LQPFFSSPQRRNSGDKRIMRYFVSGFFAVKADLMYDNFAKYC